MRGGIAVEHHSRDLEGRFAAYCRAGERWASTGQAARYAAGKALGKHEKAGGMQRGKQPPDPPVWPDSAFFTTIRTL